MGSCGHARRLGPIAVSGSAEDIRGQGWLDYDPGNGNKDADTDDQGDDPPLQAGSWPAAAPRPYVPSSPPAGTHGAQRGDESGDDAGRPAGATPPFRRQPPWPGG